MDAMRTEIVAGAADGSSPRAYADEDIQALIDNGLSLGEVYSIMSIIEGNLEAQKRLYELAYQKFLLQQWWQFLGKN